MSPREADGSPPAPVSRGSPPLVFAVAVAAAVGLAMLFPRPTVFSGGARILGVLPLVTGSWLHLRAWRAFRDRGTTVRADGAPQALVTDGPYRWTRNPMYLSGIVILLGVATILGSVASFLVAVAYGGTAHTLFLPAEERMMEERFGAAYREYRASVPTWI